MPAMLTNLFRNFKERELLIALFTRHLFVRTPGTSMAVLNVWCRPIGWCAVGTTCANLAHKILTEPPKERNTAGDAFLSE